MYEFLMGFIPIFLIMLIFWIIGAVKEYIYSEFYFKEGFFEFLVVNKNLEIINNKYKSPIRVKMALNMLYIISGICVSFWLLVYVFILYGLIIASYNLGNFLIKLIG